MGDVAPDSLHVFRFGPDGRMYVHGEEVVLAREVSHLRGLLAAFCGRRAVTAEDIAEAEAILDIS